MDLEKRARLEDDDDDELIVLLIGEYKRRKSEQRSALVEVLKLSAELMEAYCRYRGGLDQIRVFELPFAVPMPPSAMGPKMFRFLFRWERDEMNYACQVLRVPEVIKCRNGDRAPGFDVMCMLSMKYAFPTRLGQLIPFCVILRVQHIQKQPPYCRSAIVSVQ